MAQLRHASLILFVSGAAALEEMMISMPSQFDWRDITCPVIGALFKNGDLVPDAQGFVDKRQVFGAFFRVGISEAVAKETTDGNFDHLAEPKRINIFEMDTEPSEFPTGAKEHEKSTGIRDPGPPNFDRYAIFASYRDTASETFNLANVQAAISYFETDSNDFNPFIDPMDNLLMGSITNMFKEFGDPPGDSAILSTEEMRNLFLFSEYPSGFKERKLALNTNICSYPCALEEPTTLATALQIMRRCNNEPTAEQLAPIFLPAAYSPEAFAETLMTLAEDSTLVADIDAFKATASTFAAMPSDPSMHDDQLQLWLEMRHVLNETTGGAAYPCFEFHPSSPTAPLWAFKTNGACSGVADQPAPPGVAMCPAGAVLAAERSAPSPGECAAVIDACCYQWLKVYKCLPAGPAPPPPPDEMKLEIDPGPGAYDTPNKMYVGAGGGIFFDMLADKSPLQLTGSQLDLPCTDQMSDAMNIGLTGAVYKRHGSYKGMEGASESESWGGAPVATFWGSCVGSAEDAKVQMTFSNPVLITDPKVLYGIALVFDSGDDNMVLTLPMDTNHTGFDASDEYMKFTGASASATAFEAGADTRGIFLRGSVSFVIQSITGDPHLTFVDGGLADFRGEDQQSYAMLSTPHLSLNAKIEEAAYHITGRIRVNGTFLDVVYHTLLTASGNCVRVEHRANDAEPVRLAKGCATPTYEDGKEGSLASSYAMPEGLQVTVDDVVVHHVGRLGDGTHMLVVASGKWRVTTTSREIRSLKNIVWVEPAILFKKTGKPKRQLDISVVALADPLQPTDGIVVAPHGLLGQAYDGDDIAIDGKTDRFSQLLHKTSRFPFREVVTAAQAEGAIEGEAKDYRVRNGFATEFAFSRFNSSVTAPPRKASKLFGQKRTRVYSWKAATGGEGSSAGAAVALA